MSTPQSINCRTTSRVHFSWLRMRKTICQSSKRQNRRNFLIFRSARFARTIEQCLKNHRKSLIQHCKRNEQQFELTKVQQKCQKQSIWRIYETEICGQTALPDQSIFALAIRVDTGQFLVIFLIYLQKGSSNSSNTSSCGVGLSIALDDNEDCITRKRSIASVLYY